MPSQAASDQNVVLLHECLKTLDSKKIDFKKVGENFNLGSNAARMRYYRLLKILEPGGKVPNETPRSVTLSGKKPTTVLAKAKKRKIEGDADSASSADEDEANPRIQHEAPATRRRTRGVTLDLKTAFKEDSDSAGEDCDDDEGSSDNYEDAQDSTEDEEDIEMQSTDEKAVRGIRHESKCARVPFPENRKRYLTNSTSGQPARNLERSKQQVLHCSITPKDMETPRYQRSAAPTPVRSSISARYLSTPTLTLSKATDSARQSVGKLSMRKLSHQEKARQDLSTLKSGIVWSTDSTDSITSTATHVMMSNIIQSIECDGEEENAEAVQDAEIQQQVLTEDEDEDEDEQDLEEVAMDEQIEEVAVDRSISKTEDRGFPNCSPQ